MARNEQQIDKENKNQKQIEVHDVLLIFVRVEFQFAANFFCWYE